MLVPQTADVTRQQGVGTLQVPRWCCVMFVACGREECVQCRRLSLPTGACAQAPVTHHPSSEAVQAIWIHRSVCIWQRTTHNMHRASTPPNYWPYVAQMRCMYKRNRHSQTSHARRRLLAIPNHGEAQCCATPQRQPNKDRAYAVAPRISNLLRVFLTRVSSRHFALRTSASRSESNGYATSKVPGAVCTAAGGRRAGEYAVHATSTL